MQEVTVIGTLLWCIPGTLLCLAFVPFFFWLNRVLDRVLDRRYPKKP